MMRKSHLAAALLLALVATSANVAAAQITVEPVDDQAVDLIKKEGLENSHVMDYMSWMTDVFGGRLTGSPELDRATDWAVETLEGLELENVKKEAWGPFGVGWTLKHLDLHARTAHGEFPVTAYPKAWSPGTDGRVSGEVVYLAAESSADLEQYRGKLKDKFVLLQEIRDVEEPFETIAARHDDESLLRLANAFPQPNAGGGGFNRGQFNQSPEQQARMAFQRELNAFIFAEMPLALLDRGSKGDYGTIFVSGAAVPPPPASEAGAGTRGGVRAWDVSRPESVPQLTVAVEHYNRMMRLLELGIPVTLDMQLGVAFFEDDPMEYNITGEIRGTDPAIGEEIVMVGGHYDSWHAGTGATDNASGSAVMMEVMRILKAVYAAKGTEPRRTIRIGLWTGEEQGLIGSREYVAQHFAESAGRGQPPSKILPEHEKFSAYYNMDNGTGKIRGVYLQGNEDVAQIFRSWLAPFEDMGASTISLNNTGGTDHQSFDGVGLPGFQFIQEPISYSPKTHHSNMDVYDHAIPEDLMQAATIIASFAYHTAERDELIPRKELPVPTGASSPMSSQ